jgi:hypothetical protein
MGGILLRRTNSGEVDVIINGWSDSPDLSYSNIDWSGWKNIVATWDGSTITLYIGGTNVAESSYSTTINDSGQFEAGRYFWADRTDAEYYVDGDIADVRLYNRCLSAEEVQALANMRSSRGTTTRGFPVAAGDLIAWYPFSDGSVRDYARNSNYGDSTAYDGSAFDGPTYKPYGGPRGRAAYDFDGSNDFVVLNGLRDGIGGPISVCFWSRADSVADANSILNNDQSGSTVDNRFNIHHPWDNGKIYWDYGGTTDGRLEFSSPITEGDLEFWVYTASSSGMKAYQNATEVASGGTSNMSADFSSYPQIEVARYRDSDRWDGLVSDLRFYNRALTQSEIEQIYQNTRPL